MNGRRSVQDAYALGVQLATHTHLEKTAFLGGIAQAGKFLVGMGNLGAKGSRLARISPHHVGMPLGMGIVGAVTADEGQRMEGLAKGLAGGLVFNAAMPLGASIGKRILAPGFSGKGSARVMKGIGFSDDAVKNMTASQRLNKPLHDSPLRPFKRSIERSLGAGTASRSQIKTLGKNFSNNTQGLNLSDDMLLQQQKLQQMFNRGSLSPQQQADLKKMYSEFTSGLYQSGYTTGTSGQRAALKGIRIAKGTGIMAGGMGLGMTLAHPVESALDSHPASVFDAAGRH